MEYRRACGSSRRSLSLPPAMILWIHRACGKADIAGLPPGNSGAERNRSRRRRGCAPKREMKVVVSVNDAVASAPRAEASQGKWPWRRRCAGSWNGQSTGHLLNWLRWVGFSSGICQILNCPLGRVRYLLQPAKWLPANDLRRAMTIQKSSVTLNWLDAIANRVCGLLTQRRLPG